MRTLTLVLARTASRKALFDAWLTARRTPGIMDRVGRRVGCLVRLHGDGSTACQKGEKRRPALNRLVTLRYNLGLIPIKR